MAGGGVNPFSACETALLGHGNSPMTIRPSTESDLTAIVSLFTESVHKLGAAHYDESQRNAWAPVPPDFETWAKRLSCLHTLLVCEHGVLAGFMSHDLKGHIEFLYTGPGFARRGVASLLLQHAERSLPGVEWATEASLVAKPFFLRQGFDVIEEQTVIRGGVAFRRFAMRKAANKQRPPV